MIIKPSQSLSDITQRLLTQILPDISNEFNQADTALISQLLATFAEEFERSVDIHMQDIQDMQTLFTNVPEHYPQQAPLNEYCAAKPASWHLQDVTSFHAKGFEYLIALHSWTEEQDITQLNQEIWQLLRSHAERHKFSIGVP